MDANSNYWKWFYLSAYNIAVKHGYQGTEEEWINQVMYDARESAAAASASKTAAEEAQTAAESASSNAEAYSVGTRGGDPVTSEDVAYHNNAKYYSEEAGASETAAEESAEDAEAWAVGQRGGVDVDSEDPTYHNNSKYYYDEIGTKTAGVVADWLDEHVDPETGYVIDDTLTIEGAAADAKATGDAIDDVKSALVYLDDFSGGNLVATTGGYKRGYYLDADGTEHIGAAWAITQFIPVETGKKYRYSGVTTSLTNSRCFYYNNGTPILDSVFQIKVPGDVITAPANATHIRFTVNINNGDVNTFSFNAEDDSLNARITNTEKTLSPFFDGVLKTSAYNKATNVSGYLDATANIVTAVAWEVTDFIAVIPGAKYVYNGLTYILDTRSNCFFYDSHKLPLLATKFIPSTGSNILNIPANAFYVRFTVNHNDGDMNTFNFKWYNPLIGTGTTLEVSNDGTKTFSSINDAYNYAYQIQSAENPVTILIYPGTYREVLECTSANGSPYAWGAYVSFIGVNKKDVIWRDDTGLYANSPLHTSNPGLIKGITFIATHDDNPTFESTYADHTEPSQQNYGSYGLHIDDPTNSSVFNSPAYETIIEDCVIISRQHAAIGIGLRANQTLIIRNSYFLMDIPPALANAIDSKKGAFLFHRIMAEGTFVQNMVIDHNTVETNMNKALYTYNDGGGISVDAFNNMFWSDANGTTNIIQGATTMFSDKSFGNNLSALNKTT